MDQDNDFTQKRAQTLARLATLQRLQDEAARNERAAMLQSIERLIAVESEVLRRLCDRSGEAA